MKRNRAAVLMRPPAYTSSQAGPLPQRRPEPKNGEREGEKQPIAGAQADDPIHLFPAAEQPVPASGVSKPAQRFAGSSEVWCSRL